jgi:thiamine biosynthesis lipoprotein
VRPPLSPISQHSPLSPIWPLSPHSAVLAVGLLLASAGLASADVPVPVAEPAPGAPPGAPLAPSPRLDPPGVVSRRYHVMGTELVLTAYVSDTVQAAAAFAAAHAEVARIEALMTDWERKGVPPSDILRVNAAAGDGRPVAVSAETFEVIAKALDMSRRSGGAFDISFAAMHGLWKFDEDLERKVPSPAEVAERRRLVNWRDVLTDPVARTVRLRRAGMRIGLGGIAKGYAVDRASAVLRAQGLSNFMVQAGGDLFVAGSKGPAHWMVGVRDPRGAAGDVIAKMPIEDHAFSTAGDYERSFVLDGRRYHHIIDPKTGYPATASREVTIFAPSAFLADALDDAVFILGPKKGLALCRQFPDTAALIVDATNHVWMSPSLAGRLERTAEPKDGI